MNAPAPVRARTVLVTALVVGLATYGVLRLWVDGGRAFPHPSYLELAALLLIGGTALVLGRRVRRMALGLDGPHLTPITAARTFVLAQASAVTGGALAGLHLAAAVFLGAQAQLTGTWSGVVRSAVLGVVAAVRGPARDVDDDAGGLPRHPVLDRPAAEVRRRPEVELEVVVPALFPRIVRVEW